MQNMNKSVLWGIYYGLTQIAVYLITMMFFGPSGSDWVSMVIGGLISIGMLIFFVVKGTIERRNQIGGYINYGQAFISSAIIFLISSLIYLPFTWLYMGFIDPTMPDKIKEMAIQTTESMMRKMGSPEEAIDSAVVKMEEQNYGPTPGNMARGAMGSVAGALISSLLFGIFLRKERKFSTENSDSLDA